MEASDDSFRTPCLNRTKKLRTEKGAATPLLIPPSPCMKKLGYGTGVTVYLIERFSPAKGSYQSPWAVKKINSRLQRPEFNKRLEDEMKILKSLAHPNIIGYRSQGKSQNGDLCLLMESGEESLADLIETRLTDEAGPFTAEDILKVAKALASALHYLHTECHLLHGDLKSANVLVKEGFEFIKVCDFGVTVKLNDKLVVDDPEECYVGTECWSAPEALDCSTEVSNKSDMFSYGLVLWEMLALCPPHQDKLEFDSFVLEGEDQETVDKMVAQGEEEYQKALGTRPGLPEDVPLDASYNQVLELFSLCTNPSPSDRPSALQVLDTFFASEEKKEKEKEQKSSEE